MILINSGIIGRIALSGIAMICLMVMPYGAGAQDKRINIESSDKTFEEVFKEIENQTGVRFAYNRTKFPVDDKINHNLSDLRVDDAVTSMLMGRGFSYKRNGYYIIIFTTPTNNLSGTVVDERTGIPIDSAVVSISARSLITTRSDENGKFEFNSVPIGDQKITVSAQDYISDYRSMTVEENRRSEIYITLKRSVAARDTTTVKDSMILEKSMPVYVVSNRPPSEDEVPRVVANHQVISLDEPRRNEPYRVRDPFAPKVALRTNALLWSTLSPNMGAEFKLKDNISLNASASVNPFDFGNVRYKHLSIESEIRYWIRRAFEGHFAGVNAIFTVYDAYNMPLLSGSRRNFVKGNFWSIGVSYGYHLPLGGRWGLEFNLGLGYINGTFDKYDVKSGELRRENIKASYFGPSKIGISLLYFLRQ